MIGAVILHMSGRVSFKNTVTGAHILMAIAIAYLAGAVISHWKYAGFDRMVKANLGGGVILVTALGMDMIAFYLGMQKTDVVGRIGLLIYICLLGWEVISTTLQQLNEGRKAALYKELAMKDMPTGLYNRNAYNRWMDEHGRQEHTFLVTFDLNNLKMCNDTMGHTAGDQYIAGAAEIISKAFGETGETFRIGGDEFCTIMQNAKESDIRDCLRKMRELEQEYNQKNELVTMRIACGYAVFDAEQDRDLEDTRARADIQMYRNKKELKNA
jgi:diguanylate cyclase (GGDEF)-like protein